jgi:F0F1-type ATP synthase epsilon subunit
MAVHQQASTGEFVNDGVAGSAPKSVKGKPVMHVKVYSPFQVYFDEEAFSISAENGTGPFDVLPHHHNFITLLNPCEMVVRAPLGERRIRISGGVMHVKADNVAVFLDV